MLLPQTADGWEIFFAFIPRFIEGRLVWFTTAERFCEGCNYGSFFIYRLRGSKMKSLGEEIIAEIDRQRSRTILDDLADLAD